MRVAFIVNPRSGARRRGPSTAEQLGVAAREAGLCPEVSVTRAAGDAERLARDAVEAGCRIVTAVGGDGTANEVARGVLGTDAALAVLPRGSGNGFARDFGMSLDLARGCRQIAAGRERRVDVGELDGRPFLMSVGFGIDARVIHRFHREAGDRRGQWPYFTVGLTTYLRYRPVRLEVVLDGGRPQVLESLTVVAANTRQFGAGAMIAPAARPDDGKLVLVIVPPLNPLRAASFGAKLFSGGLDMARGVEMVRFSEARITAAGPIEAQLDGEPVTLGQTAVLGCRAGALRLWVPD